MRDMIPPGDRSIRNIPIPANHKHIHQEPVAQEQYPPQPPQGRAPRPRRRRRPGRFILWAFLISILCVGVVAGISMLYAGAAVTVQPRAEDIIASTTILAQVNAPVGILSYTMLAATGSATTAVPATGTKKVSRQATGVVTITSTYSVSQRFIANTRLQAPDSKIYRLAGSITLPANSSVNATVNAESPGSAYNRQGLTTFTFPGYQGDPRYTKFSAKSQGALSGGFVGEEPAVADADLRAAKAKLQQQLEQSVTAELAQKLPAMATAIPGTLAVTYGDIVQSVGSNKTATLSQSATATGATVNIRDLASALARRLVKGYNGEAVDFKEQGSLTMSVASTTKPTDQQITLTLGGNTTLVWQFDPNALKQAMLGKSKGQFQTILESFAPAIASATATIRPFWIKNFPSDPNKINIIVDNK